jgi:hypothetical protein
MKPSLKHSIIKSENHLRKFTKPDNRPKQIVNLQKPRNCKFTKLVGVRINQKHGAHPS